MNPSSNIYLLLLALLVMVACSSPKANDDKPTKSISNESFGTMPDGTVVDAYTLTNENGVTMKVITYGGIITSLTVPDRAGNREDIVLGYDNLDGYLAATPYFGAIIGRYGNRIARGKFSLDSTEYTLVINNIGNHLHGGTVGFDKVIWAAEPFESETGAGLRLTYTSADGEEGYPGTLSVTVTYWLDNDNTLSFDYVATTDKKTIVNLTQHSYFNLTGTKEDILGHELVLNAAAFLPVDSTLIPLGEIRDVAGTAFDFTVAKPIGRDIAADDQQITFGLGYDHCWALNQGEEAMKFAASVYEPKSGRFMEVFTTEPGIQFYSGNFLDGTITGKNNQVISHRYGLCLETQHFPDSPNQPQFPSVVLNPGEEYHTTTKIRFSTK